MATFTNSFATFMNSLSREDLGLLWIVSSTVFAILFIAVLAVISELDRKMQLSEARSKRKGAGR